MVLVSAELRQATNVGLSENKGYLSLGSLKQGSYYSGYYIRVETPMWYSDLGLGHCA